MTISSTTVKNSYSGDGSTTSFNYTFKIFADSDLQVIIRSAAGTETVKTITTHYTVSGAGNTNGGSITFTSGNIPTATETVVLRRAVPQTQAIDYIANDPFPAESHEEGLDRATMTTQQIQEELDRAIKLSRTNTMTSTEFTVGATERANKILAFDSSGEISVTQELGTYQGTDATTTTEAYVVRDIIKSTTAAQLNNVYICVADSVVGDLLTDTDHFELLVDAVSAATSATSAASSASAAATSATNAATSASAAATSASNASTSESNASTSETNAATSATNAATSATSASTSATSATASATTATTKASEASTSATNAASSATSASSSATTATTKASEAATSATNAASSATTATTKASEAATSATNAATSATAADTAKTAAQAAQTAAELAADNFDDTYLGSKASDPTVDNDGDALTAGDLYFNTTSNELKYYTGSAWVAIAPGISNVVEDTTPQLGGQLDVNGNAIGDGSLELIKFSETGSAVNEITVTNAATGNGPEISATGDDTNIDLKLTPKGAGKLNLDGIKFPNADGTANQILKTDGSGNLSFTDDSAGIQWQSVQTTAFTAQAGKGYPCNTTSAAFTVTLPSSPSAGDQIALLDYAGTFATNNLTLGRNSNKIEGGTSNKLLTTNREGIIIVYVDTTQGWVASSGVNSGTQGLDPITYSADFLVVAGGGSGDGGGGGAGGFRTSTQTVNGGSVITVTVGDGGSLVNSGSDSSISGSGLTTITSAGGGKGGTDGVGSGQNGTAGGSGGGGGGGFTVPPTYPAGSGGSGNTPSTSPSQGNSGGGGGSPTSTFSQIKHGGGGGAGSAGTAGVSGTGTGAGGNGSASSITGSSVTYAGGGGGGGWSATTGSPGGSGGGGPGSNGPAATPGTANTGGGGGGTGQGNGPTNAGTGGKGVVIISVPTANYSGTTTGSPTVTTSGSNTIMQFNGSGSYTA